ncbi:MAG: hypothetical protein LBD32_01545, partial [Cytophagales bacterium]|nr:hypothetical protein [Cytophagales bacterium]
MKKVKPNSNVSYSLHKSPFREKEWGFHYDSRSGTLKVVEGGYDIATLKNNSQVLTFKIAKPFKKIICNVDDKTFAFGEDILADMFRSRNVIIGNIHLMGKAGDTKKLEFSLVEGEFGLCNDG